MILVMQPTVYVVTYHKFNHVPSPQQPNARPLDARFLNKERYIHYLIDQEIPEPLKNQTTLLEHTLSPVLHEAGGKYLGEWSFLLAEEKLAFCQYPFFMVSSRFYEKNGWLYRDLNEEWDQLFSYFQTYGWGYLPSYNRPLRWIDLSWEKQMRKEAWRYQFFPFKEKAYRLIEDIYGLNIPRDYRFTADLFCNYIGFKTRDEFLAYVTFYKPFIQYFFDAEYRPKRDISEYVRTTGGFRNEKSFTFLLELLCHLFFFANKKNYFALHYDGYYSIDESAKKLEPLENFPLSLTLRAERWAKWNWRKLKTEGRLAPLYARLKAG